MNAATAHTTESDTMSNGKHLDISPRTFVDRCSAVFFRHCFFSSFACCFTSSDDGI